MSEPNDPTNSELPPSEEPTHTGGRRNQAGGTQSARGVQAIEQVEDVEDLDFESDGLLDSLLNDPFPPPPPTLGPKLHEPLDRLYPQDEVTVVGQELEQLLAASASESAPPPHPTAPAPADVTVVGRGLDELLARTAAESVPPPGIVPKEPVKTPPIPRPAMPPRPAATIPRPRTTPTPGAPTPARAPLSGAPTPTAPKPAGIVPTYVEDGDDEQTRVIRAPSEESAEGQEPTVRLPPPSSAAPPTSGRPPSALPESFVPPAAFVADSLSPARLSELATPVPEKPIAPASVSPTIRAPYESEPPTGHLRVDGASLRAPAVPTLSQPPPQPPPPRPELKTFPAPSFPPGKDPVSREAWIVRAELFESEAQAATDPQAKARALLVASELWAIVGDLSRAREVAIEACAVTRNAPLAGRQLRWLAAGDQDYSAVATALETEARTASTPEGRTHAAYLAAEVHRLPLDDASSAKKKYDLLFRAPGADPRGFVMKLCDQLATSDGPPKLKVPDVEEFAPLATAVAHLSFLRGDTSAAPPTPELGAFDEARRALGTGDRKAAGEAISRLSAVGGLGPATRWLSASLFAHDEATRASSIDLLKMLLVGDARLSARRALAARALELGDKNALAFALETDSPAFDASDRVVLAALSGSELSSSDEALQELATDPRRRPLAMAAALAGPARDQETLAGPAAEQSALALGRRIGRGGSRDLAWLAPAVSRFVENHPRHALERVLRLELAVAEGSAERVAAAIAEWPRPDHDATAQRDRELLAALVYELGGETASARAAYERAHAADPTCEACVRALLPGLASEEASELLEGLGEAGTSGSPAALHFVEAALRRGDGDEPAFHALLEKAVEADPKLVLPYRLGEQRARRAGDAERLLGWLRARRATIGDRLELALELVREALLVAETDLDAAAALLREAGEARTGDIAITELYERVAPAVDGDPAEAREAAAARAGGLARRRLLLEAAFEHERAGNREGAIRCARAAVEADGNELARIVYARVVAGGNDSLALSEELIAEAKQTEDPVAQRELFEQLSELEAARGNASGALLWHATILERSPRLLSSLRRLEHAHLSSDRRVELERVETALAEALSNGDAAGAARLAARLRLAAGDWAGVRPLAELAVRADPNAVWALRALSAHARAAEDAEATQAVERRLFELASRPIDKATLALRAAEAASRLERWEDAQALLENALDHAPDHLVALAALADVLEQRGEPAAAARALEALAEASRVDAHKVNAWYEASVLWLDRVGDPDRARAALEQAVALDLGHQDAVARLQSIYVARGDRQSLAELLQRRLEHTTDPEERITIEVARGRALAELGEPAAAKAALSAALDANPDHYDALEAFAQLCLDEGDWLGAEQAFIRLARHAPDAERQAQIYRKLGELYDVALPNAERAELAYQEVLKREPNDTATIDRLLAVYGRLGTPDRAVALATQLVERAETPEARREHTIRLASVLERIAGNKKQAEVTLEKARREWPHDAGILRALIELHQRHGETRPAQLLLDRAAMDARRALGTGRFESALFETLATVADLRGLPDGAAVAHATLAALAGDEMPVQGGGARAGGAQLDELLAPDLLGPSLRALLAKTGPVLDKAFAIDPRALRATPLPPRASEFLGFAREVARAFGLAELELLVSPALGPTCIPASTTPPVLVLGNALLDSEDDAARYCLLVRALTVLKANGAALARTAPIDLGPLMGGLLSLCVPTFTPQGVDPKKLADVRAKLQDKSPGGFGEDVKNLALEVSGSIGNRASQLATALYQWGNRTALLAVGDPLAVLRALAMAAGNTAGPPAAGPERVRWIVRNAEARDLMIFSVSEQYGEARRRLGLGNVT